MKHRALRPAYRAPVVALFVSCTALCTDGTQAAGLDEFKVKREPVFEFAQKPAVTCNGDTVTIAFEARGFCDVTIAVEDANGRILRHLASGLLGPNAPAPFQKNTKRQTIFWDGKDDQGRYLDDKDRLTVRVSLGLRPRFERTLYWSPKKKMSRDPQLMRARPEGVYVYDGGPPDHVTLFSHAGDYLRTIYPLTDAQLRRVRDLKRRTFPQGDQAVPLKWGMFQTTLLTSGSLRFGGHWPTNGGGRGAMSMAVDDRFVYLINQRLNRIPLPTNTNIVSQNGPITSYDTRVHSVDPNAKEAFHVKGQATRAVPWDAALSPDGTRLYLAGISVGCWRPGYYKWWDVYHGVARLDLASDTAPQTFLGVMDPRKTAAGADNGRLDIPASIDVDRAGNVYVAEFGNNRVQVFSPDGKPLRSIPVPHPALVRVVPKRNEIYVFTWAVYSRSAFKENQRHVRPMLTRFGPINAPKKIAAYPLDVAGSGYGSSGGDGRVATAEVDPWTDPPTVWLSRTSIRTARSDAPEGLRLFSVGDRQLTLRRDFNKDARKEIVNLRPARHLRQRLYFNPKTERLYAGESHSTEGKSFSELTEINPETGHISLITIPFETEDLAFDLDGLAYLRTENLIVRYDPRTWEEVPFDYGQERRNVGYSPHSGDRRAPHVAGAIVMPGEKNVCWHLGGMAVAPTGHIAVVCWTSDPVADRRGIRYPWVGGLRRYTPVTYPGRRRGTEIHVYDEYGRVLIKDAVGGTPQPFGIGLDAEDNLYVAAGPPRMIAGQRYPDICSCTLFKVKAGGTKILSSNARPVPMGEPPTTPAPMSGGSFGSAWVEGADWFYGGIGLNGFNYPAAPNCSCQNFAPAFDLFNRSFAPEMDHYSLAILDSAGNLIVRVAHYGNVDGPGPNDPAPNAADGVTFFHPQYIATHTDRRVFVADTGNARIVSIRLSYGATERVALKDVAGAQP